MDPPLQVEQLTRSYGKRRGVTGLTFTVTNGEVFGFLGPNGAGKTTTIRQIMGLLRPTSGHARVFGLDCWRDSTQVKAKIGYLPGDLRLYEKLTGEEFLDFFASFRARASALRRHGLAERLELDLDQRIRHLSKGNRQKLAIVQALMHDAPLLILDEPSSGLDPLMQAAFIALLREEHARGKTIFLSSHMLPEVERIAHRVAIVREGHLVVIEEVAQLTALRQRHIQVVLREPVAPERFSTIEGVRVLTADPDGLHLELEAHGALAPLLRVLSDLPVDDLTIAPQDLERVFMHYYNSGDSVNGTTLSPTAGARA